MSATTLRQLSRDFAQGKITAEEYRGERAKLLNGLVEGTIPLTPFEPPAPKEAPTEPATVPAAHEKRDVEPTLRLRKNPGGLKWVAATVVVLIVGGAAGYFLTARKPASTPAATAPSPTVQAVSPSAKMIQAFLEKKDWRPESLDRFFADWVKLALAQREAASKTPLYKHFSDETYARVVEVQTLVDLGGDPDAVERQKHLLEFASDMGFQDPRFKDFAQAHQPPSPSAAPTPATSEQPSAAPSPQESPPAAVAAAEPAAPQTAQNPTEQETAPETQSAQAETAAQTSAATPATETEPAKPTTPPAPEPEASSTTASAEPPPESAASVQAAAESEPEKTEATATKAAAAQEKTVAAESTPPSPATTTPPKEAKEVAAATAAVEKPKAKKPAAATRRPGTLECRAELARQRRPYCRDGLASGGLGPLMVVLRGGTFSMGGDAPNADPVHKVTIAHSFAISMREIGADEYTLFCKATGRACPSQPWSADYPVVNVSWDDAVAYTAWLSKETGHHYRLPTEAEWEYGARAGSTGRYPSGDELLPTDARFSYQRQQTSPLPRTDRTINRNRFRLYNMLGNVREWVLDGWHSSYQGAPTDGSAWTGGSGHVVRGGSYHDGADKVQSASRERGPAGGDRYTGFRVVQEISAAPATSTTLRANSMKWVAERGLNQYTLQLFAVNSIASIEKIVARHPRLEIMIMPSDDPHEPYRVFYGIFDTRAEAKLAYAKLPRDILSQVKKPLLRSFAQISQSLVQR